MNLHSRAIITLLFAALLFQTGTVRANNPARGKLVFSAQPTDAEISAAPVFDEPLMPLDANSRPAENKALSDALTAYAARAVSDDCSSLEAFAVQFPQSRWTASFLLHLGTEYFNYGYFSKALDAWQRSWALFQASDYAPAKPQADRALGELARMYSRIGRTTELDALLKASAGRELKGPATQLIHAAQESLWMMKNKPGYCFRCGPLALDKILLRTEPKKMANPAFREYMSPTNGFALTEVAELSDRVGMNYQMAYRSPGAEIVTPAVAHWKVGHYAALVERRGDRVLAQDFTFRGSVWITTNALDDEASGYFLIPPGPLPAGWRSVGKGEGRLVRGRGMTLTKDPKRTSDCDQKAGNDCFKYKGMTTYSIHAMLVSLSMQDNPLGYAPPLGPPVQFVAEYHQLEAGQPANFSYSNFGYKWTGNWISYITDNPTSPDADVTLYVDGGGTFDYTDYNPTTQMYQPEPMSQTILVKTGVASYEMRFGDGSKREFTQSNGSTSSTRLIFLTQIIDPLGHGITLQYDSQLRITGVVDAIGQVTTLQYTNLTYTNAITSITDPFGRTANFAYYTNGLLAQITDVLGLTSQYTYDTNEFIVALTTPYGTSTFQTATTNAVNYVLATDPEGQSELAVYSQSSGVPATVPASQVPHGLSTFNLFMDARDSFYWDRRAYAEGAWDYSKAVNFHWLHLSPDGDDTSGILESEKAQLEGRVWYNYPGQPTNDGPPYYLDAAYTGTGAQPTVMARVLDDGSTQLSTFGYNSFGKLTNSTDPLGRSFSYDYATNNIDLLQTFMTRGGNNELIGSATYNASHQPLTVTDAAGNTTAFGYNALGLLASETNANGAVTTFNYNTNGYLMSVQGPLPGTNDLLSFTYDAVGRIQTATDTEGYTVSYEYDNMDRITQVNYPDGTFEQVVYDRLDPVAVQDRLGRWSTNTYNDLRQLIAVHDHLGRISQFEWCQCGAISSMTDPMGRTTSWTFDLQSRPVQKQFPDGSIETYTYENMTSRIHSREDEAGQSREIEYYPDNEVKQISYPMAAIPTPTVSFTYDSDYDRVTSMTDGVGTTVYSYYPVTSPPQTGARQLASVSGPLPNSLATYEYDNLNRVTNHTVAGGNYSISYDVLGRAVSIGTPLGTFQNTYLDSTMRIASIAYPNGQTNFISYYNNAGNQRVREILDLKPNGSLLSSFGYSYDALGLITAMTNQWDTFPELVWEFGYDADNELTNATRMQGSSTVQALAYGYDAAANRVTASSNGVATISTFNALNQLVGGGAVGAGAATYEWDGEKRLTAINLGSHRSEFSYDGLGHRCRIVEKTNGVVATNLTFLWCDSRICEERDGTGSNVLRQLMAQGETVNGANYYYTRDQINSVRELTDVGGTLISRYDYDPYGQRAVLEENIPATMGFTSHFYHEPSGLHLALYRALDTANGRWLSRDPLGEQQGQNLYIYANNSPPNGVDVYGLEDCGTIVSEDLFRTLILEAQRAQDEDSAKWGPLSMVKMPFQAAGYDSGFISMNDITFRGEKMLGGNLNYFAQGQVWSTYGP
jgi:RHS repeat-associated protein